MSQEASAVDISTVCPEGLEELGLVRDHLREHLTEERLQDLTNMCCAIKQCCTGDGAGLSGGTLIDMLVGDYFQKYLPEYAPSRTGESDMKIGNIPLSQKKINGKSTIALDWSKNPDNTGRECREHFSCHVFIINLKSDTWWKKNPKNQQEKLSVLNITYNDTISAGLYLIDKQFCKRFIELSSNNKTNTLIDSQPLYAMLKRSMATGLFIPLPEPNQCLKFSMLDAFSAP